MPVIALPTMKIFIDGAAAVRAVPTAKRNLATSSIFLLSKNTSSFPLTKSACDVFLGCRMSSFYQKRHDPPMPKE